MALEVFDNLSRAIDADQGGHVVERSIVRQEGRVWRSEELLVGSLESHRGRVVRRATQRPQTIGVCPVRLDVVKGGGGDCGEHGQVREKMLVFWFVDGVRSGLEVGWIGVGGS